ncbi:hypothetical protein D1872_211340 [compost metagenome]
MDFATYFFLPATVTLTALDGHELAASFTCRANTSVYDTAEWCILYNLLLSGTVTRMTCFHFAAWFSA